MSYIAAAAVAGGSSVLGGILGYKGAKKAAEAQLQAGREAIASQERMFNRSVELQEPFRQGGVTGLNRLMLSLIHI